MSCELLKASVAIFLISTCAVHSQETIIKEINGERYEIGTFSIVEDHPELFSLENGFVLEEDFRSAEEVFRTAMEDSSHFHDLELAKNIVSNVGTQIGTVFAAENLSGVLDSDLPGISPVALSNENDQLSWTFMEVGIQQVGDVLDLEYVITNEGTMVTVPDDRFGYPPYSVYRYFTSRRLPSNDNQHFKPDRYTAALDVRPGNYPTCGGNLWVTGFRVGYGKDSPLFIEHKHQDKCFDEDVIFLPEGLRAYDRGGVTAFLNQPIDYFCWQ